MVSVDLNGRGAKLIQVAVKEVVGAGNKDQTLRFGGGGHQPADRTRRAELVKFSLNEQLGLRQPAHQSFARKPFQPPRGPGHADGLDPHTFSITVHHG